MRPFSIIFVSILIALTFASCQSNEEKLIRDYQSTITNSDGSTTKINIGKKTFKSIETIDVDGKFVYSLQQDDSTKVNKDSLQSLIKQFIHVKNGSLVLSAIASKNALNCGSSQWSEKYDYQQESKKYRDGANTLTDLIPKLGKTYQNYDNVSFQLIKAVYDVKLGEFETKGITYYFVYDKQNNKILESFKAPLGDDLVKYYADTVEGFNLDEYDKDNYSYDELMDKSLKELISML